MKIRNRVYVLCSACLLASFLPQASWAEDSADKTHTSVKIKDIPADQDTSVIIKKGVDAVGPEFEIVSGEGDILGDPKAGLQESYASWKEACQAWKKETKELNKDNQILVLNCNSPSSSKQGSGLQSYRSMGSYKMKVRIKSAPSR